MSHAADLQGVLKGLIVRYLDDSEALDELHEAVCKAVGTSPGVKTWNAYKAKWLGKINRLATSLEIPKPRSTDQIGLLLSVST